MTSKTVNIGFVPDKKDFAIMNELWVPVKDFLEYEISDQGRVRYGVNDRLKSPGKNQQGIPMVNFSVGGKQHVRALAKLVAQHFVPGYPGRPDFDTPICLNGDRTDCRSSNLAWRPYWFAREYHRQFDPYIREYGAYDRRPVMDDHSEIIYHNSWEAARTLGLRDKEIQFSMMNHTIVFPTLQTFSVVYDEADIDARRLHGV